MTLFILAQTQTQKDIFNNYFANPLRLTSCKKSSHFLGIKYQWTHHSDGHLDVHMNQEAFAEQLIINNDLVHSPTARTPYRAGIPIDSIPKPSLNPHLQQSLSTQMRSIIGSLLWLSQATRTDLATVVSLLAQHQSNPSPQYIKAAKYAIRYVSGTKSRGINFSRRISIELSAFLNFSVSPNKILPFFHANWRGQNQSRPDPKNSQEILRFTTRSMSGFLIYANGPLHWISKRQKITACSTAEAKIYATDECVKEVLRLQHILEDFSIKDLYMPNSQPIELFNDNTEICHYTSYWLQIKFDRHIHKRDQRYFFIFNP